jgi:hypothetical protein
MTLPFFQIGESQEFQQLLMSKYGKLYDVSFAKRSIPGKTFV